MIKGTVVLEGGAARGIFSAGVLDYLMEQNVYISNVIGISAGSCNAVSYVSKQIGRARKSMLHEEYPFRYMNLRKFVKTRSLMDMDTLFDSIPNEMYPFDYDAFFASDMRCLIGVTNCITGEVDFLEVEEGEQELMKVCRASSSLPLVSPIVNVNGTPYLDGGIANAVPLDKALSLAEEKIVVILTRRKEYRKTPSSKGMTRVYYKLYKNYPALIRAVRRRYLEYNETMDQIERLEEEGKIFVIRPEVKPIDRLESKTEVLDEFYSHGYKVMKNRFQELQSYLSLDEECDN